MSDEIAGVERIEISYLRFLTDGPERFVNASVSFDRGPGASEVSLTVSATWNASTTVEQLRMDLAQAALIRLRKAAEVEAGQLQALMDADLTDPDS